MLPAPSPAGALDAVSATTAYAAQDTTDQGAVLRTTDGGHQWRLLASLTGELESVDFVSPRNGVAVGVSWDTTTNLPQWQVYATDSGGRSWVLRRRLDLRAGQQVSGVWMANRRRGLILTTASFAYPQVNGGGSTPAALLQTSDGGRTWTRDGRPPLGSTDVFDGATFTYTGQGGWAGWFLTSSGLQATTDTDEHWHLLRRRPPLSTIAAAPFIGIERITPSFGIGWTSDNGRTNLWRTLDAGNHWGRVSLPPRVSSSQSPAQPAVAVQVSFTNPRIGWLVADGIIWRTTNGGRSWMGSEPAPSGP